MPKIQAQQSVGEQLDALLKKRDVSQRELGRLLTQPNPAETFEGRWKSKTRWVQKVITGDVAIPTARTVAAIETALDVPGYFTRPARPAGRARAASRVDLERRLEEVATQAALDVVQLRKDLAAAVRRIRALERQSAGGVRPATEAR